MESNDLKRTDDGRNASIISYFWFIGWLIAYFAIYKENKTALASYQLRQTLLFMIAATGISWISGTVTSLLIGITGIYAFFYLGYLIQIGLLLLWIIGFIGAINGEQKPIPFFGEWAQRIFPNI